VKTIYISIGNSDDKLSQSEWSDFCFDLAQIGRDHEARRHGTWFSVNDSRYQNMCICIELPIERVEHLRIDLQNIAGKYRQDSIAMAIAETELVTP
jgi:hypothetical protein